MKPFAIKAACVILISLALPAHARESIYFQRATDYAAGIPERAFQAAGYDIVPYEEGIDRPVILFMESITALDNGQGGLVEALGEVSYLCHVGDRAVLIEGAVETQTRMLSSVSATDAKNLEVKAAALVTAKVINDLSDPSEQMQTSTRLIKKDCAYIKAHYKP